jgi:hypothetical protein
MTVARTPIHSGENLAEELEELGVSTDGAVVADLRPGKPDQSDCQRQARHYRRHRPSPRALVRKDPTIPDESAGALLRLPGR